MTTPTCKITTTRGKKAERICKSSAMSRWQKRSKTGLKRGKITAEVEINHTVS